MPRFSISARRCSDPAQYHTWWPSLFASIAKLAVVVWTIVLCVIQVKGWWEPFLVGYFAQALIAGANAPQALPAAQKSVLLMQKLTSLDSNNAGWRRDLSVSYETLVTRLANARLDKHSRFTDWRRRPLTDRQLSYALDDYLFVHAGVRWLH